MSPEEKKEILENFQKKFDIFVLSKEILDRTTYKAKYNKVYEAKLISFEINTSRSGRLYSKTILKTENKEILESFLSADFPAFEAMELMTKLGTKDVSLKTGRREDVIGKRYKVFYGSGYNGLKILERL